MLLRNRHDGVHVTRTPGEVHGHDGTCAGSDFLFYLLRIDIQSFRLDVDRHRSRARVNNCIGRRTKCHRRRDDFITGPDS